MPKFIFFDFDPKIIKAFQKAFKVLQGYDFEIIQSDVLKVKADVFVSPANSFGWMDGGIDEYYMAMFRGIQELVMKTIQEKSPHKIQGKFLPVGSSLLIDMDNLGHKEKKLICAPTMQVPQNISRRPENVYYAMVAILKIALQLPDETVVAIPGLGTGVGRIDAETCAQQMLAALIDVQKDRVEYPDSIQAEVSKEVYMISKAFLR